MCVSRAFQSGKNTQLQRENALRSEPGRVEFAKLGLGLGERQLSSVHRADVVRVQK